MNISLALKSFLFVCAFAVSICSMQGQTAAIAILSPVLDENDACTVTTSALELIGKVKNFDDLQMLYVNGKPTLPDPKGKFSYATTLKSGSNDIVVKIKFNDNTEQIQTIHVNYELAQEEVYSMESVKIPNIYAVIVGVSEYEKSPEHNLNYASKDALMYFDFITSKKGGNVPTGNIKLLVNDQATTANVTIAITDMLRLATEQDVFIFYYSGHGVPLGNNEELCFLMNETNTENNDYIGITSLKQSSLENMVKKSLVKKHLYFIDACYSGLITTSGEKSVGNNTLEMYSKMSEILSMSTIITSSSNNEKSYEDPELNGGHGIFSHYLVQGLKGAADGKGVTPKDGYVSVNELYNYIYNRVPKRAYRRFGFYQTPAKRCIDCNDFPLSQVMPGLKFMDDDDYEVSQTDMVAMQAKLDESAAARKKQEDTNEKVINHPSTKPSGVSTNNAKYKPFEPNPDIPVNLRELERVVFTNADGSDRMMVYVQTYNQFVKISGELAGRIIHMEGQMNASVYNFRKENDKEKFNDGRLIFENDWKNISGKVVFDDGQTVEADLFRISEKPGTPVAELTKSVFKNDKENINLEVASQTYNGWLNVAGRIGENMIEMEGALSGFVFEFKPKTASDKFLPGKLVFDNEWKTLKGELKFLNGEKVPILISRD